MSMPVVPAVPPGKHAARAAEYLGYLDGLRAVAALFVVLHHVVFQVTLKAPLPPSFVPIFGPLFHGHEGVDVFIVISGFCLMLPIVRNDGQMRRNAWRFFVQRARRILPPYYLAVLFSLGLIALVIHKKTGTIWDASLPVTGKSILMHLLLVQDACGEDHTVNYVLWSIAVEWRIYFLFPLLVLCWRRVGPMVTTILTVLASHVAYCLCDRWFGVTLSLHYIGLFAMGMLGASIAHTLPGQSLHGWKFQVPWGWLTVLAVGLILSFDHPALYHHHLPSEVQVDEIVGLGTMALLVQTTRKQSLARAILSYQPLVFIGTFAYSVYLIHAPPLQVFWQSFPASLQQQSLAMLAILFVLGVPAVVGVSYGFFVVCERPFLTKKKPLSTESLVLETALKPAP